MAKRKPVTSKAVEQEEFNPEPIEEQVEVTNEEQQATKKVAKKKGESSFGQMLAAANVKRKERKKLYGEG